MTHEYEPETRETFSRDSNPSNLWIAVGLWIFLVSLPEGYIELAVKKSLLFRRQKFIIHSVHLCFDNSIYIKKSKRTKNTNFLLLTF